MLEKSYIHHLKALMCGINASRVQGHSHMFTMCHASLKMVLLLYKEGLVKTTVPITVLPLGTIHKRRLPNFLFFGVPSLPLSPHVSYGSKTPLGRRLLKPTPPSPQFLYEALFTRHFVMILMNPTKDF